MKAQNDYISNMNKKLEGLFKQIGMSKEKDKHKEKVDSKAEMKK